MPEAFRDKIPLINRTT